LLVCAWFLMAGQAEALQCDNQRTLGVVAVKGQQDAAQKHVCILGGERAIHLAGRIDASLVKARAYLQVSFFDVAGRTVGVERFGPWMGAFQEDFQAALVVPTTGWRVVVGARTESQAPEASGRFALQALNVSEGVVARLRPLADYVSMLGTPVVWQIGADGATTRTGYRFAISSLDGDVKYERQGLIQPGEWVQVQPAGLAVGYYDVRLELTPEQGKSAPVDTGMVVLPEGTPPHELRIGMDAALSWYGGNAHDLDRSFRLLKLAGVASLRDRMSWSKIEQARGVFTWGRTLDVARRAFEAGFDTVEVFHDSPAWASGVSGGQADRQPPSDYAAVSDFGRALARDLGPYVRSFEYWNEQNSSFFAGYPFDYASGLKAFASGLKAADPEIRLLVGAASGKPGPFYEAIHANGISGAYDARNQHYYGRQGQIFTFHEKELSGLEQRWGVAERPGWLTEMGYSLQRDEGGQWRAAELAQAEHLAKTFAGGFAAGYDRVFYFFWRELIEAELHTWGIMRENFSPRPAYLSLALLTRHLAGKQPVAVISRGNALAVFFRSDDGRINAVSWGLPASSDGGWLMRGEVSDIFGRPVVADDAAASQARVLLIRDVDAIPAVAVPVALHAEPLHPAPALWMSGTVELNDRPVSPAGQNRWALSVEDGATLSLKPTVHVASALDLVVTCEAGAGVEVVSTPTSAIRIGASGAQAVECQFAPGLSSVGASHARVRVRSRAGEDVFHLDLIPDASRASFSTVEQLKQGDACPRWVRRSSRNLSLDLKSRINERGCATDVVASIGARGETWVFPSTPTRGSLRNAHAIRVELGPVAGVTRPPTAMLLQLVERGGAIWLVDLHADTDGRVYTGIFNLARSAPWAKDSNGVLDLDEVNEIMIGWGGYGGNPGQVFGYSVGEIQVLSRD